MNHAAERIPTRIAAFWGLGAFATTTMLNGVSIVLLFFLVTYVKVEPVIAGALLFGSRMFDAFIDPPIGIFSDRTESRWGRRRPYLLGASFFCGLSFALLFNVPDFAGMGAVYLYVGAWLFVYTVAYAVFTVPYMAMPGEMTDDYHERTRLMSWRTVFMTGGNLAGAAAAPALAAALGGDRAAYGEMGVVFGVVISVSMLLTFAGTSGARQTPRDAAPTPFRTQLGLLRLNKPLLILMATKIVIYLGIAAFSAVMLFYFSSVLKKDGAALGAFFGIFALSTIIFTPLQARLARRLDKRNAYMACMGFYTLGLLSWLLSSPDESMAALAARAVYLGGFNAGLFLYGYSMLVDTYAYDHQLTGLRREGFLASAISFVEKFSLAVGPLIIGTLLSLMGFDKNLDPAADQSDSAVRAIYIGFVWIPVATQLIAMLLLRWYRLGQADLRPIRESGGGTPVPVAQSGVAATSTATN